MAKKPRIAIIGGGIGGTSAAILLQQGGYDCQVYEQAPVFTRIGAGINLCPNSMRILRHIGLEEKLCVLGQLPVRKLSRQWDTGEVLFAADTAELSRHYGAPFIALHRGDLLGVLTAGVAPGTLHFGKRLVGLEPQGAATRLAFADGSSVVADIVIGADGVNSKVREILLGPEPPLYTGKVAYRSIFPSGRLGGREVPDNTKWWGEDQYVVVYFITRPRDEIYFVTGVPEPEWGADTFAPMPADMARLRRAFAGYHPEVRAIVEACPEASRWPILEREPLALWSRGAVVMLGDACHPMTPHMGQGAGMAIEDAVMIRRCLDSVDGEDPETAFRLYEANRFQRTSRVQRESHDNKWMLHEMDHTWLYGYDALTVPLVAARPEPAMHEARAPLAPA